MISSPLHTFQQKKKKKILEHTKAHPNIFSWFCFITRDINAQYIYSVMLKKSCSKQHVTDANVLMKI